jgi:hypothetical protein
MLHKPRPAKEQFLGAENMLEKTIEQMKQQLDQMILTEDLSSKRLLQQSQVLDRLIVAVMIRKANKHHGNTNGDINEDINGNIKATSRVHYVEDSSNKEEAAAGQHQGCTLIDDLILTPIKTG